MTIEVDVLDVPEQEQLVAWLFSEGIQWGEIVQQEALTLTVYPRQDGGSWVFTLDDIINALEKAKHRLISLHEGTSHI